MKSANIFKILLLVIYSISISSGVFAEDLDSTNYKLIGVTTTAGGGFGDSTNYSLITTAGEISADPRNYSNIYRLDQDPSATFVAAQPTVQCFETSTPLEPDLNFNTGGAGPNGILDSVAVQTDGKIIIAGSFTTYNGVARGYVARLNTDGTLDTTFLNTGAGANAAIKAIAIQSDGKILLGGTFTTYNGTARGRIARVNTDGSLDTTFLNTGAGASSWVTSMAIQPDGKIIIGGDFGTYNGTSRLRIARLNTDGSLDTTFAATGAGPGALLRTMALQSDGKVIIGGQFGTFDGTTRGRLARLNTDGTLDTTFLNTGAGASSNVYTVAIQSDGKIIIGGDFTTYNGTARGRIARVNTDGSLDTTFLNTGAGADAIIYNLVLQSDGRIIIGGSFTTYNGTARGAIARLQSNGSLDTTFLNTGAGANNTVDHIAIQRAGKAIIVGNFTTYNGISAPYTARVSGITSCTSGPTELLTGGMIALCGVGGCYDKGRFEIEPYVNPSDTLYSIQISTDNFASDIKCIDGSTFQPKTLSSCNINDFRTETYWEDEDFNVKGLQSGTEYYIRITALHGDFTQSDFSSVANSTTGEGSISFDIDIAISSGYTTESAPPYSIAFSGAQQLIAGAAATTATSLIWLDVQSSSTGGVSIIQFGKNGGLLSATTAQNILSQNENLDAPMGEGFGLQSYYIDYDNSSPYYGEITAMTNYAGTINTVGEVSTDAKKIYSGDGPIKDGRMGIYLKARAGVGITPASDYSEEIYFVLVPLY